MADKTLKIKQQTLVEALAIYPGGTTKVLPAVTRKDGGLGLSKKATDVLILELPKIDPDFLDHLLEVSKQLTEKQRDVLIEFSTKGMKIDWDTPVSAIRQMHVFIKRSLKGKKAAFKLGNRWYPTELKSKITSSMFGEYCSMSYDFVFCGKKVSKNLYVDDFTFMNDENLAVTRTPREILSEIGIREIFPEVLKDYDKSVAKSRSINLKPGQVFDAVGPAVILKAEDDDDEAQSWWAPPYREAFLGTPDEPAMVVADSELEKVRSYDYGYNERVEVNASKDDLPMIRLFDLERKRWVYADYRDLKEHKFQRNALEKLILPDEMSGLLKNLFAVDVKDLFGDALQSKHGGMIILADGPPGVGKTLTAEVFAESTGRPLYVMEMNEVGVNPEQVEKNLQRIFDRVTRWNAVLLMDECDIFLAQRDNDLEHNVMVGIFLRLMDYYKGLLFLTSNRGDTIDKAFKSRITLRMNYPELTPEIRRKIWNLMLQSAGVEVKGGLDGIPDEVLNGRQIRNLVRLAKVLYDTSVTTEQLKQIVKFAAR